MKCEKCGEEMYVFLLPHLGGVSGWLKSAYICIKCGYYITTNFDDNDRILIKDKMKIKELKEYE